MEDAAERVVPIAPGGRVSRAPLLLALFFLIAAAPAWGEESPEALPHPVVVLDPGHGGVNLGAAGPGGILEKELVLDLALRVRDLLEERSELWVVLTRERDLHLPLRTRAQIANDLDALALVSLHMNSSVRPGPRGYETFFLSPGGMEDPGHPGVVHEELAPEAAPGEATRAILGDLRADATQRRSARLAEVLDEEMARRLVGPNRGVLQAPFDVLIYAEVPAVVVESGFLNHPVEGRLLLDSGYRQRIAEAISEGLLRYLAEGPPP